MLSKQSHIHLTPFQLMSHSYLYQIKRTAEADYHLLLKHGRGDDVRYGEYQHFVFCTLLLTIVYLSPRAKNSPPDCFLNALSNPVTFLSRPNKKDCRSSPFYLVEVTGFEPATSSSRTKRATKLRHTSKKTAPIVSGPLAAELGFEPRHTESESAVLPLHNSALHFYYYNQKTESVKCFYEIF